MKTIEHPKQLSECGIDEKYLRKVARQEGISYRRAVQIAMEEWGKLYLKQINRMMFDYIKNK